LWQRPSVVLLLLWSLAALLAGCSTVREPACAAGEQRAVSELLYFGTAKPAGVVSAEEWSVFLGNVVTPLSPGSERLAGGGAVEIRRRLADARELLRAQSGASGERVR